MDSFDYAMYCRDPLAQLLRMELSFGKGEPAARIEVFGETSPKGH
jgi:hypothetical protein